MCPPKYSISTYVFPPRRTRTVRHSRDPAFRATFSAELGRADVREVVVRVVVEAVERVALSPTVMGELTLALRHIPATALAPRQPPSTTATTATNATTNADDATDESPPADASCLTYCLSPASQVHGHVLVSASYLPTAQRLSVCVIKATDLRHTLAADAITLFYPFVRVLLLNKGRLLKKKKTGYCSHTPNPQWNQTLIFPLQPQQVETVSVVVCVCSRQPVTGSADLHGVKTTQRTDQDNKKAADQKKATDHSSNKSIDHKNQEDHNYKNSTDEKILAENGSLHTSLHEVPKVGEKKTKDSGGAADDNEDCNGRAGDGLDCAGDGRGQVGERYVGKVVLGTHVQPAQARDFFTAIIKSPRTQHTQWLPLK
ncbi:synaptotagmin-1-like [Hyalella azteca]|uniref:Synaptotagmin-1-like n=1 Tax=Hyalella azteca TaxID=294128 RepID=A0A8B7NLG1_HYAAZ|nr:synaptotagmin-1-like [Hyalella azteca]